jgi:hypothetical protein
MKGVDQQVFHVDDIILSAFEFVLALIVCHSAKKCALAPTAID